MPDDTATAATDEAGRSPEFELDAVRVHELFSMWDKEVPPVEELRRWFADDLVFEDPLQRVEGLQDYYDMNLRLLEKNHDLQIRMEEHAQNGRHIMFTFSLGMAPSPRLPDVRIHNRGMTYVRLNDEGKIEYHRDDWDFMTMFLSAFPDSIQRGWKWLVGKLG